MLQVLHDTPDYSNMLALVDCLFASAVERVSLTKDGLVAFKPADDSMQRLDLAENILQLARYH